MTEHYLKVWPEFFEALADGTKPFEIRKSDRHFRVGDVLYLREFDPETGKRTGRQISKVITYITTFQQKEGYVVLGLK